VVNLPEWVPLERSVPRAGIRRAGLRDRLASLMFLFASTTVLLAHLGVAQASPADSTADSTTEYIKSHPAVALQADSIVLERTTCFGTCPAYHVSVSRSGSVHFESRTPGDSGRIAHSRVSPERFRTLAMFVVFGRFFQLPNSIQGEKAYCPGAMTDQQTARVTVFVSGRSKTVEDYGGCTWAPVAIRGLEREIDEVSNSKRWTRPARF
jgi:hypothetical protein